MMQTSELVYLPFVKSERAPELLGYELLPCPGRQSRFRDRIVARPVIDLRQYRCRAVIDWLEVEVSLSRPTQFWHVQQLLEEVTGCANFVQPIDKGPGGAATRFSIKLQDARFATVASCLSEIQTRFGLLGPCLVTAIEVSVDFYPSSPSSSARTQMTAILARHLFPRRDFFSDPNDRPRFSWGSDGRTAFTVGAKNSLAGIEALSRWPDDDKSVPADATLYVGRKGGPVQWKVMEKLLDRQHPDGSSVEVLVEAEKRARIEVTLNREQLVRDGVDTFDDLQRFSFTKLQGSYFRFMLPTFATSFAKPSVVGACVEKQRRKRFWNAGIAGLIMMDRTLDALRGLQRPMIKERLKATGRALPRSSRTGKGSADCLIAYAELNDRVSTALEKLGHRESLMGGEQVQGKQVRRSRRPPGRQAPSLSTSRC